MTWDAETIKLYCEIAAFGLGAIFLFGRLVSGQYNYGMQVSVEVQRAPDPANDALDNVAITLKLQRPDGGRIELTDVRIEMSEITDATADARPPRTALPTQLLKEFEEEGGKIVGVLRSNGPVLPPSDGTQLAYHARIARGESVFIDTTIVGKRTGPAGWFGNPQWRASAVSLPDATVGSARIN